MKDLSTTNQKGFSTLELMIAMAVIVVSISAVIMVVFSNQTISLDDQLNNEALTKASQLIEGADASASKDFGLVSSIPTTNDGIFQKSLNVVLSSDNLTKYVTGNISWTTGDGRSQQTQLYTVITDQQSALGGDTCNPSLSGDWTQPQILGHVDFPSSAGATDVDAVSKKAYITSDPSSAGQEDFYIYDVSDPTNPVQLSKLNTGIGLNAVKVTGKYAYVAQDSATAQLQIIDISTPSAPVVIKSFDVTATGDTAVGHSIFYLNHLVYLGLTKSTGSEFYVIDVTNPLSPIIKVSYETDTQVSRITVKNNIAYLATPDDPLTGTPEQLRLLDVSQADTGTITLLNTFSWPNPATLSGESVYISKDGNTLYLGRGGLNSGNNPEFFSLNVSNPGAIPLPVLKSKFIGSSINALTVRDHFAFFVTSDTNLGFQIWDLNNLTSPTPYGSLNVQQTATGGMDCDGNVIYIAQKANRALQIVGPFTAPVFDYALSNSGNITVIQGSSGNNTVTRTLVSGTTAGITLSTSSLPAGTTASFTNNPCSPTCSSTLTISTTALTPLGTYPITVTGLPNGAGPRTTSFNLVVNPPFDYSLSNSGDITVPKNSTSSPVIITKTLVSGTTIPVTLSISGLPARTSINSLTNDPCSPTCSSNLTIRVQNSATSGTYTITVTGSPNGTGPRTTTFKLIIP